MIKTLRLLMACACLTACALLAGCFASQNPTPGASTAPSATSAATTRAVAPKFDTARLNESDPLLKVYDVAREQVVEMPLEEYLLGVLAGEMPGDWPLEALKAQAILARTFVHKFVDEKDSMYSGADISTDIKEAQAYSADGITDSIRRAVEETQGEILVCDGELPYAWFYAHGGGVTALAGEGLDFKGDEPEYTQVTDSRDADAGPDDVRSWKCEFTESEVRAAAADAGLNVERVTSVEIGERGPSGRATTLLINGQSVSAPSFRIAIGSKEMKSTLLDECEFDGGELELEGRGYGHGVGMSQWGARELAAQGWSAEDIVTYYFKGAQIAKL